MKIYTLNLNRFLYCEIFRCDFFAKTVIMSMSIETLEAVRVLFG